MSATGWVAGDTLALAGVVLCGREAELALATWRHLQQRRKRLNASL
jgi:hypothetical protein